MAGKTKSAVEGFIILGPGHPAELCCRSFGRTMTEAWERHIGNPNGPRTVGERETLRSRWAQKGWRPVPARMEITAAPPRNPNDGD